MNYQSFQEMAAVHEASKLYGTGNYWAGAIADAIENDTKAYELYRQIYTYYYITIGHADVPEVERDYAHRINTAAAELYEVMELTGYNFLSDVIKSCVLTFEYGKEFF